ncbi:MAG TPA: anhydro-N-acetylmuramic acid kinase [Moraxellaceae bacterium]|nr:anhydro-N-acetylmuramic acid kinase [Moraxellaceae bacterium]
MSELYIGLMSGTSMDAIDAVLVDFSQGIRLLGTHSAPLPDDLRQRIAGLCSSGSDEIERLGRLDVELGERFAEAARQVLASSEHTAAQVRAIGSHGQTLRHRPGAQPPFTLQVADPNVIAERCGIPVVADFRRRDMAAGGQGAPLVPAFHAGVFASNDRHRIVLNLGGIANITVLPAGHAGAVTGHDTGPANLLMDAWCQRHTGQAYDAGGEWAASGDLHEGLLSRLLGHPYFSRPAPKSTGREDFNPDWLAAVLASLGEAVAPADVQATLLELTARTAAAGIGQTGLGRGELLMCGGGAFNARLWHRLASLLPEWRLISTAEFGLAPTWVEATAFAWLARQTLLGHAGNLPAVTGARGPRVLGAIHAA